LSPSPFKERGNFEKEGRQPLLNAPVDKLQEGLYNHCVVDIGHRPVRAVSTGKAGLNDGRLDRK